MQSIVEVVCVGNGSNKTYNSVYTDPGFCKMVIVQDDDKFPSPRLCLLRRWPNFEGGFGFNLYEDLFSSTGALKVEEVVRHSPAEAGGLRKNDVIIEINGENIELKSFFPLVEILKEACSQNEMELLVLAEQDAQWYRVRNITVNGNFPNIEYCETPYYGHILKPLDSVNQLAASSTSTPRTGNSQIEFHSSTGQLYRTTLVIDKERDSVYRRIEELPSSTSSQSADQVVPPLRPDGGFRHPGADNGSVRVYYRRDRNNVTGATATTGQSEEFVADSGHGSLSHRRSTPLTNLNTATMSPYSTLGKSYGESLAVDLLHDKWADLMDKYLDTRFRSGSAQPKDTTESDNNTTTGTFKKSHMIRLSDSNNNANLSSKRSRSRGQSPNDASFSYLYSGRDDYQTASATSFRDLNRQASPFNLIHRGSPITQSHRYTSPSVQSPSRLGQRNPNQATASRPQSQHQHQVQTHETISSSSYNKYESSLYESYTANKYQNKSLSREASPSGQTLINSRSSSGNNRVGSTKTMSNQLGFQLDESEVKNKGVYYVKYVEANSPSAMAGLKDGDKITRINGKSTLGMSYDQFCDEIIIAQQQQLKNNMIHLMVMRKSAKSTGTSSFTATSSSNVSNMTNSTVLPITNLYKDKSSSFVDEGYVPDSATSSTTTTTNAAVNQALKSLVSIVRVTSPGYQTEVEQQSQVSRPQTKPAQITEVPAFVPYESSSYTKPNVNIIYDSQEIKESESKIYTRPQISDANPSFSNVLIQKQERERLEREQYELELKERERRERELREKIEKERIEYELRIHEQEERERREREEREKLEIREKERLEYELKIREIEERERREREQREREEREREQRQRELRDQKEKERLDYELRIRELEERERNERELREREEKEKLEKLRSSSASNIHSALAALTTLVASGADTENEIKIREQAERERREREEQQFTLSSPSNVHSALAALTTIVVTGSDQSDKPTQRIPLAVSNETVTTSTMSQIEQVRRDTHEEIIHQVTPPSSEHNHEVIETDYSATYQINDDADSLSQYSEEERARREFAEQEFLRQQEVMHYLVFSMENPSLQEKLRTFSVYNSKHFFGFGIAFHTEHIPATLPSHKLVYPLVEITPNSPSDEAGMRNGQRVVAVNGLRVSKEIQTLEDVVEKIEDSYYSRNFTDITVIEPELWSQCMDNPKYASDLANFKTEKIYTNVSAPQDKSNLIVNQIIDSAIETKPVVESESNFDKAMPRLISLRRQERREQYGFDFKTIKYESRHVAMNVREGYPADRAGLRDDDIILEVNGESVHGMDHEAVVKKIASNPNQVDLFVVKDVNTYVSMITKPALPQQQEQHDEVGIDLRVPAKNVTYHKVNLIPGFKGLGISLAPSGIISAIEPNSPSDRAGLRKDHRIVEVNGANVRDKSNKEIASFIKENEANLTIGVIDTSVGVNTQAPSVLVSAPTESTDFKQALAQAVNERVPSQSRPADELNIDIASQSVSSATGKKLTGARVCNLLSRQDYDGFGFSMRPNDKGPHQISSTEANSPAEQSGLRADDLILKVNDVNVVGERYSKTVTMIKNESERGRLKLEVIDPKSCPPEIRATALAASSSGYSTVTSNTKGLKKPAKSDSIQNLREITSEMISSNTGDRSRAVSVDTGSDRNRAQRPYSMTDIDRVPGNSTMRSINSFGSTATGFSQSNLQSMSTKSVGNLSTALGPNGKPKFKRCIVQLIPEFKGYGFTLNSKVKPKYMIFTVDPDSPSYAANLRATDVIVEIDKKNIRRMKFDKVRQLLSETQKNGQVEILAISKEGYMFFKNKKKRFSSTKLVTLDNTEPYSTLDGLRTRDSSVNYRAVSSDNEGDKYTSSTLGVSISRPSTEQLNKQSMPSPATSTNKRTAPIAPQQVTGTDLDGYDIILCTIKRREDNPSIGLTLSPSLNQQARSLSRASTTTNEDQKQTNLLPVITSVEPGTPAEQSGLRAGDLVLEIDGKSTHRQPNSVIGSWIRSAGNSIEFTISREKRVNEDQVLKESAKRITEAVLVGAISKLPEQQSSPKRLSRKDSASLNSTRTTSQQNSPQFTHSEIKMSSSKLHDGSFVQEQSPNLSNRARNQSEPAINEMLKQQSETSFSNHAQSSPMSKRSSSSYNLPRDAPIPRLCRVRAYEEQLGFTVAGSKSSRGVFKVNDISPNSPAAHSGLQNDDYIIEISGVSVEEMDYNDVVSFIREKKMDDDLQLLVADRLTLQWYKQKKIPISSQVVPRMQYIETLLKEELEKGLSYSDADLNEDHSDQYQARQ